MKAWIDSLSISSYHDGYLITNASCSNSNLLTFLEQDINAENTVYLLYTIRRVIHALKIARHSILPFSSSALPMTHLFSSEQFCFYNNSTFRQGVSKLCFNYLINTINHLSSNNVSSLQALVVKTHSLK